MLYTNYVKLRGEGGVCLCVITEHKVKAWRCYREDGGSQIKWGPEYQTCLVFEWSKVVWSPNGPTFECCLNIGLKLVQYYSDASIIQMFAFWIPSVSCKLAIQNSKFAWRRLWMIPYWDFTLLYHLFQGGDPSQRGGFQDYDPYSSNYVEYPHRAPTPPSPSDRSASPPPQHREPGKANANFLFVLSTCFDRIPAEFFLKF